MPNFVSQEEQHYLEPLIAATNFKAMSLKKGGLSRLCKMTYLSKKQDELRLTTIVVSVPPVVLQRLTINVVSAHAMFTI
jgi:hypothetical protein